MIDKNSYKWTFVSYLMVTLVCRNTPTSPLQLTPVFRLITSLVITSASAFVSNGRAEWQVIHDDPLRFS